MPEGQGQLGAPLSLSKLVLTNQLCTETQESTVSLVPRYGSACLVFITQRDGPRAS